MTNQVLFVRDFDDQPIKIETHYTGEQERRRPLSDVADVIYALKQVLAPAFDATPINRLSLHAVVDGVERPALESDLLVSDLSVGRTAKTALIIKANLRLAVAVPTSRLNMKRRSSPGSPSSPSPSKKSRVETLVAESESGTADDIDLTRRSSLFRERVIARDNHCAVTRDHGTLEAAHILAHSWWRDGPNWKDLLPIDLKLIVSSLDGGIDNIRNGILLRRDLASAFDEGKFGFVFRNGHFYFIAITTEFLAYDGTQMDENLRQRSDGTCWWSMENRPHSRLVEFHFRNSVFRRMSGSGWMEDEWDSESDGSVDEVVVGRCKSNSELYQEVGIACHADLPYSNVPEAQ
ncbi:hypothetical protein HDU99_001340 [Rhizoclosmatium hyalinum]|nr:hypothetical protein HDU99_001340 [Rhizoclosmatium hyalinum]